MSQPRIWIGRVLPPATCPRIGRIATSPYSIRRQARRLRSAVRLVQRKSSSALAVMKSKTTCDGGSGLSVPYYESLVVNVPANIPAEDSPTLGCIITGGGSLTIEGGGPLVLVGRDISSNESSYTDGTFIDAGTVALGSPYALGSPNYEVPDSTDLTVDDGAVLDLNGQATTVTSLNSSYRAAGRGRRQDHRL